MSKLPSPDFFPDVTERQVAELEVVMAATDRMLRVVPAFFHREYRGPLRLVPPEDPTHRPVPEAFTPLPNNVVPITAAPSYRPPIQGDLIDTAQHRMAEAARADIEIHALASSDITLEAFKQAGEQAA